MRESDRRVKYTKMVLRESLLKLLEQKPINNITVTELCQNADVNRGTFYAHYSEPFELMKQIEDELYNDLRDCYERSADMTPESMSRELMAIANQHREICKITLGENADQEFVSRIHAMSYEYFKRSWRGSIEKLGIPDDYFYHYLSTGVIEIVRHWLVSDENRAPDEVANIMFKLTSGVIHMCDEK